MAEATHTAEAIAGLARTTGRGFKIFAGKISIQDAETFDTGLDKIYAAIVQLNIAPTDDFVDRITHSISGGILTIAFKKMQASATNTWGANSTDSEAYIIAVGVVK